MMQVMLDGATTVHQTATATRDHGSGGVGWGEGGVRAVPKDNFDAVKMLVY